VSCQAQSDGRPALPGRFQLGLDQPFLEAHARRIANVLTEGRRIVITGSSVKTDGFRLARSSFKPQRSVTASSGVSLESRKDLSCDAPPAPCRLHEHSFDLSNGRLEFANGSATNRPAISIGNQKSQTTFSDVFWMKTVKGDAGISLAEVLIESPNEDESIF
jgi:hypothetical protein